MGSVRYYIFLKNFMEPLRGALLGAWYVVPSLEKFASEMCAGSALFLPW